MFHMFHPALLRLASSHLVLFQNGDPCPPNILAHFSPRVAGQVYGREGRCGQWGGGGWPLCCPGAGGAQCQWSLVAPRPGLSRPGPRESRERERQLPVPSELSAERTEAVWPVPGHQWPAVTSLSDSVQISGVEREARDVSTIGLRVSPAIND